MGRVVEKVGVRLALERGLEVGAKGESSAGIESSCMRSQVAKACPMCGHLDAPAPTGLQDEWEKRQDAGPKGWHGSQAVRLHRQIA